MQKSFVKLFFILVLIFFIAPRPVQAMPEIFPFNQIKSGMSGKAYTVVDNSGKIEQFDVNIVGVTDEGKGSMRKIMAEVSGDVIDQTGGLLHGMSGSPVYINGKLVGALANGFKGMNPRIALITPIEDMMELWNLPDPKAQINFLKISKEIEYKENEAKNKAVADKKTTEQPTEQPAEQPTEQVDPVVDEDNTEELEVFYFDDFDTNSTKFLRRELQPFGMKNLLSTASSAKRGIDPDATLEPGSALGVALIYGDFSLGATGTVTAVNGKNILAFGHSFLHAGNVNYFMTEASVIGSVSGSADNGAKLAGIGHIIGRVNQDRESGISGILGMFPASIPMTVTVHDNLSDRTETYNASIAYNENLVPKLGAVVAYSALSKMADSLAETTVNIEFKIKTDSIKSGELVRRNMFYNPTDVGQVAIVELMQALNLVCSNTKEESNIFGVDVNIDFDAERRTASIVSIKPDKKKVKPGDTVNLTVELQPYRKPVEKVVLPYTVPLTAQQGSLALEIHGGALVPVNQSNSGGGITADSNRSYEDKIKDFLKTGKNYQLVVEVVNSTEGKSKRQLRKEIAQARRIQERLKKEGKTIKQAENKVDTNYIVDNVMRTILSVGKA